MAHDASQTDGCIQRENGAKTSPQNCQETTVTLGNVISQAAQLALDPADAG
jgi:hypothetical protein